MNEVVAVNVLDQRHVELHIKGGKRGAIHEWVVDFDRLGNLKGAYCYKGPNCEATKSPYYPKAHVPADIVEEARKALK